MKNKYIKRLFDFPVIISKDFPENTFGIVLGKNILNNIKEKEMLDTKVESSDLKEIKGHLVTLLSIAEGFAKGGGGFSYNPSEFVSYAIKISKLISKLEEKYGVKDVS